MILSIFVRVTGELDFNFKIHSLLYEKQYFIIKYHKKNLTLN